MPASPLDNITTEESFGVVPLRLTSNGWEVLMVHHRAGHWGFPKGHREGDETPLETAKRELLEETALHVTDLVADQPILEHYRYVFRGEGRDKSVTYFLAAVEGELSLQDDELNDAKWIGIEVAHTQATFPEMKGLCHEVVNLLKQ